jgi:hypothetical protein
MLQERGLRTAASRSPPPPSLAWRTISAVLSCERRLQCSACVLRKLRSLRIQGEIIPDLISKDSILNDTRLVPFSCSP